MAARRGETIRTITEEVEGKKFELDPVAMTKKYVTGIQRIGGAEKYYECGEEARATGRGIRVALCLRAQKEKLTEIDWGKAWSFAMFGEEIEVKV